MKFICQNCEKELQLQSNVFEKAYKGETLCLDCRPSHGGKREGAGRPALGITKKVSITLPDEIWDKLDDHRGDQKMSAFLRELIMENYE